LQSSTNPNFAAVKTKRDIDGHKNLRVGLIVILILDRINWIDWIYCFLGFRPVPLKAGTKPRNNNLAFSESKTKNPVVLFVAGEPFRVSGLGFSPFSRLPRRAGERGKENPKDPVNLV